MDKLYSLKRIEDFLNNFRSGYGSGTLPMEMQMVQQLADTMRENERLKAKLEGVLGAVAVERAYAEDCNKHPADATKTTNTQGG